MLRVGTHPKAMSGWHDLPCLIQCKAGAFAIADEKKPRVMTLEFPALPSGPGWAKKLREHGTYHPRLRIVFPLLTRGSDAFLASVLDWLPSPEYTVIYTTTPSTSQPQPSAAEPEPYEMDTTFGSPVHMDLKRDFSSHKRASSNVTLSAGPLFERYQFFNPGKLPQFVSNGFQFTDLWPQGCSWPSLLHLCYFPYSMLLFPVSQVCKSPMLRLTKRWVQHRRKHSSSPS